MKAMKKYTLYSEGPHSGIALKSADYVHGMWIVKVRAKSVKHAYWLLGNQRPSLSPDECGVFALDNSEGPDAGWPWSMPKSLAPELWGWSSD